MKDFLNNKEAKDKLLDFAFEESEDFRVESATKLYEDMIDLYKDDEEDTLYYLSDVINYSILLKETGKEEKCKKILKEVIEKLEALLTRKDKIAYKEGLAVSYTNLGDLYGLMQNYEKSEIYNKKSIDLYEEIKGTNSLTYILNLARSYSVQGSLYYSMQRYKESESCFKKSIELIENPKSSLNPLIYKSELAVLYGKLGSLYESMRRYKESEIDLKKSRNSPRDIYDLASSYNNLGYLYNSMKKYDESKFYCKESISLLEEISKGTLSYENNELFKSSYALLTILYIKKVKLVQAMKFMIKFYYYEIQLIQKK